MAVDRTELAWAAGFWDGEGSAYLSGALDRPTQYPQARINQSSMAAVPDVLLRFQKAVGMGVISGPERKEGREPLYKWVVSSRPETEALLRLLSPWIGHVKRDQLTRLTDGHAPPSLAWERASKDEQLAWGAGLWDGEGSVCLLKHRSHRGHFVPEASVTQSSVRGMPEVLTRIASIAGGGHLYGPFVQPEPWAPVYRWKLFRLDEIDRLFSSLSPWLGSVKIEQARRVLSVLASQPTLPRGNPAWGNRKTHCVKGHDYAAARVRPFRGRGRNQEPPRASKQCLACLREHARRKRQEMQERRVVPTAPGKPDPE